MQLDLGFRIGCKKIEHRAGQEMARPKEPTEPKGGECPTAPLSLREPQSRIFDVAAPDCYVVIEQSRVRQLRLRWRVVR